MISSKTLLATGLTAVLLSVAPSAFAQHRGGDGGQNRGGGGRQSRGGSVSRGPTNRGGNVLRGSGGVSRGESRAFSPRSFSSSRGVYAGRTYSPRGYAGVRGGYYGGGSYARGGRYSRVAPVHFIRPYYAFRPRLSLGFGLWAGYPFAYPYAYYDPFYDPYAYPSYGGAVNGYSAYDRNTAPSYAPNPPSSSYPPSSNYPPQGSVGVQPSQSNMGGVSFQISPGDAQVIVDGTPVGTVGQFTPTTQPLGLPAGRHQIEVRAPGYRTMSFDVDIVAGQVIPYQGTLER